jgi:hypothetical protein
MTTSHRTSVTPSVLVAAAALVVAVGAGSAYAGAKVATKDLKNGAVTSAKIRNETIKAKDLSPAIRATLTGPAGAPGAAGAPGSPGISGYERVEVAKTLHTGDTFKVVSAVCPTGKKLLGGGGATQDSDMWLEYVYPQSNDIMEVQAILRPGGTINDGYSIFAVAICGFVE